MGLSSEVKTAHSNFEAIPRLRITKWNRVFSASGPRAIANPRRNGIEFFSRKALAFDLLPDRQ